MKIITDDRMHIILKKLIEYNCNFFEIITSPFFHNTPKCIYFKYGHIYNSEKLYPETKTMFKIYDENIYIKLIDFLTYNQLYFTIINCHYLEEIFSFKQRSLA